VQLGAEVLQAEVQLGGEVLQEELQITEARIVLEMLDHTVQKGLERYMLVTLEHFKLEVLH
jgi:hypothetical protein